MDLMQDFDAIETGLSEYHFVQGVGIAGSLNVPLLRVWYLGTLEAAKAEVAPRIPPADLEEIKFVQMPRPAAALAANAPATVPTPEPGGIVWVEPLQGTPGSPGTLGCFVAIDQGANPYLLTAGHLAYGKAKGDPVMLDAGSAGAFTIGELFHTGGLMLGGSRNKADCALARSTVNAVSHQPPQGTGIHFSGKDVAVPQSYLQRKVEKFNALSGVRPGIIDSYKLSIRLNFPLILSSTGDPEQAILQNQVVVTPLSFAVEGDSGSLVVLADGDEEGDAIGIVIGTIEPDWTVISPLFQIRAQLGLPKLSILT